MDYGSMWYCQQLRGKITVTDSTSDLKNQPSKLWLLINNNCSQGLKHVTIILQV